VLYRTLHDLVGGATARDLALSGRTIDAREAHALGLVVAVTAPGELLAAATEHAQRVARSPREHLVATKAKIIAMSNIPPDTRTLDI
jgi:enoyl-CoA hydratase/carnithine racemase